jgi:cation diffusion facilitator CzcD-associated flavoprotein CzcO
VHLDTGETRDYRALLVANGHHWDPQMPSFEGMDAFKGVQLHSHHYLGDDPTFFTRKRVVVLGMGNSSMDIAVEAAQTADRVFLAARRGAWIVPKYVFGRPLDQFVTKARVPLAVRQRFMETTLRAAVGSMERYGLPKPDHRPLEAHPTISDTVLTRLTHGDITPKPNIARLTPTTVVFADGSEEPADVVVYGTGYKVSFPFFDPALVSAPGNDLPLYKRVFHPDLGGLYFIALLQPLGATMPLAEAQSEWVCDHLTGRYALPLRADVLRDIARERAAMRKRYVASRRHTMQVDYDDYLYELKQERKRGARRA